MRSCTRDLILAYFDGIECADPLMDALIEDGLYGLAAHLIEIVKEPRGSDGCRPHPLMCHLYRAAGSNANVERYDTDCGSWFWEHGHVAKLKGKK